MAYYLTVEMIGIPFLSVYSNPFFLESAEHAIASEEISNRTHDLTVDSLFINIEFDSLTNSQRYRGIFWSSTPIELNEQLFVAYLKFLNADFLLPEAPTQGLYGDANLGRMALFLGEFELFRRGCTRAGIIFAHCYKVYERYARICEETDFPDVLVKGQMWFGHCRVVIVMEWNDMW
jgi:hypothetical protein